MFKVEIIGPNAKVITNGYRAVETEPTVDHAGKPVATVTLMKGEDAKMVVEPLE